MESEQSRLSPNPSPGALGFSCYHPVNGAEKTQNPLTNPAAIACCTFLMLALACSASSQDRLDSWRQSIVQHAVEKVTESVVQIETIGGLDTVEGVQTASGPTTGLIVSADGFVVTSSFNLIQQPAAIFVRLPSGERLPAEIVARNESRQVVLLKTEPPADLPVPNFIERSQVRVGQTAIAIGKVFDSQAANVSAGILSATNRIWGRAIQTDAKISPNNFGGPLVDIDGNVLGLLVPLSPSSSNVAEGSQWYDSGVGFAVPLDELRLAEMAKGRSLQKGLAGISFKEDQGYASVAEIAACAENAPAAMAGLKPGDRIVKINGAEINRLSEARHALGPLYEGDEITVSYLRDDKEFETRIELVGEIKPFRHSMLGILPTVESGSGNHGVAIRKCLPDSPAEHAGLRENDRITAINDQDISNTLELAERLIQLDVGATAQVNFMRDGAAQSTTVTLGRLDAQLTEVPPVNDNQAPSQEEIKPFRVQVHELPNQCHAYIPVSHQDRPMGILLWLGEPGEFDVAKRMQAWKLWCDERNFMLLMPQSQSPRGWSPVEIEFLGKVVNQVIADYDINPQRVAIGGTSSGAVLASLVAFEHRSIFRGLVLHDSPISARLRQVRSSAVDRLLVMFVLSADTMEQLRVEKNEKQLIDSGIPVHVDRIPISEAGGKISLPVARIIAWLDTIDRL